MEMWEGAVLIIGGLWLVGRVHRNQVQSLTVAAPVALPSVKVPGPTSETNLDGSGFLVAGETLNTGTGNTGSRISCPSCAGGGSVPITSGSTPVGVSRLQRPASNTILM